MIHGHHDRFISLHVAGFNLFFVFLLFFFLSVFFYCRVLGRFCLQFVMYNVFVVLVVVFLYSSSSPVISLYDRLRLVG